MSILIVWCMAVSGLMGLFVANVGTASETGPITNDIPEIITGDEVYDGQDPTKPWIADHDGSLTITSGGSLTLRNCVLNFLQDGLYDLDVNSGSTLRLENATITTGARFQASWSPFLDITISDSTLIMEDHSAMVFPGTLDVTNSLVCVNDSWITGLGNDFETNTDFPDWWNKFPTAQPALNPTVSSNWYGTPADEWNDGPLMTFTNCGNVTIADSRIDMLYENTSFDASGVADMDERFVLDNTNMSVINTYLSLDWKDYNIGLPWTKNMASLSLDSHIFAYNMTLDHTYGTPAGSPYLFWDTSEVYYYKWARIPVVDFYGNPIEDAYIESTFVYSGGSATIDVAYVATMNNLSDGYPEDVRILDYMDRVSMNTINGTNYNVTNSDGMVMIPLLTTINPSLPAGDIDGDHCGEYTIDVAYGAENATTYVDFSPYPNIQSSENTITTLTMEMDGIQLPRPDLTPGTITLSPDPLVQDIFIGDTVYINATIENVGGTNALDVGVVMYDHTPTSLKEEITNITIASIPAGGSVVWPVIWTASEGGQHDIEVSVDYKFMISEGNETNNTNVPYLPLYVTPYLPELSISPTAIEFDPAVPSIGNPVIINATILNSGYEIASNVEVRFYSQNPDVLPPYYVPDSAAAAYLIDTDFISVGWDTFDHVETVVSSVIWDQPPSDGVYSIYVWIDPLDAQDEWQDETTNNLAYRDLTVNPMPNLYVTNDNVTFDDETPIIDQDIVITVDVVNLGGLDATGTFDVELYDDDVWKETQPITDLNIMETKQVSFTWTPTTKGYHNIEILVDATAVVDEIDETDNKASLNILVYDGGIFDLVVNNTLPASSAGYVLIDSPHLQHGYILVEEDGQLNITGSTLIMDQIYPNQFNIIVKDNGVLNIDDAVIDSNNFAMNLFARDNAKINIIDTTTPAHLSIIADDTSIISIKGSDIGGSFSVPESDANVRLEVINSTFRRVLDTFRGTSIANLTAIIMTVPQLSISDSAEIYIYRWIEALVEDVNHYPLEGVTVDLNYTTLNYLQPILQQTKITDADGKVLFRTLSDIITIDVYPNAQPISNYKLIATFNPTIADTLGVGLPSYNDMAYDDNYIDVTITMDAVRPDLDPPVYVSDDEPGRGEKIWINTTVTNNGISPADGIWVEFRDNGVAIANVLIPVPLGVNENYNISINHTWMEISDIGNHNITVEVDPDDKVKELNESDNLGWIDVTVIGRPDLAIHTSADIDMSDMPWVVNYTIDLTVTVYNEGDMAADDVTVHVYDAEVNGTLIDNYTIPTIIAGSSVTTPIIEWEPELAGSYLLYVEIDQNGTIDEIHEDNNVQNRSVTIREYADLYINQLEFIHGGSSVTEVENRTTVTLRAQVFNSGGTPASGVIVSFYDGFNLIGYDTLPTINAGGGYAVAEITWFATADLNGNSQDRNIRVSAATGIYENINGLSNELTETLTITDPRADLTMVNNDVNITEENVIGYTPFDVNVTVRNNGDYTATNFTIDIYYDLMAPANMLGSFIMEELDGNMDTSVIITCAGIPAEGTHYLLVAIDRNVIADDIFTVNGMDYNLTGSVEEFNEANNELVNVTFVVTAPQYVLELLSPNSGQNYTLGKENNTWVSGRLTMLDGSAVVDATITIDLGDNTVTTNTDASGNFQTSITLPANVGQYDLTASADGVPADLRTININQDDAFPWLWIIIIIIIAVAGIIIGITLYLKFVGLGKTVECGECGAFIPESASRCPKCNTEFETDTAKCSICGAWVPMNSKTCPECNSEFTIGDEEIEDYKAQMQRQYDDVVDGFKKVARKELGANFTEADFQAWWATQATFVTFDQWLKEEEEMKRLGSKPCPNCQTQNSVTATICHKCGTMMEGEEKAAPPKKVRPEPVKEEPVAEAKPEAAVAPAAAAAVAPAEAKPEEKAEEKKKCPSCGMEMAMHEMTCPICSYDFEKKDEKPPEGGAQPTKKVVRKPVKKVVRRPVKKGPEGE
ncbi:MAG: hypothetical protein KAS67_03920 [Thermoplasmata archaeon]|nr:hypothetical protein [Thermoplasmata archaeon]